VLHLSVMKILLNGIKGLFVVLRLILAIKLFPLLSLIVAGIIYAKTKSLLLSSIILIAFFAYSIGYILKHIDD